MKVTPHFDSSEFEQHAAHGFASQPYPSGWIESRRFESRLRLLCDALEVIRARLGKPITILSGFRSESYNRAIGGSKLSQHVQGRAADIAVKGVSAQAVHAMVLRLHNEKAILIGGLGSYPTFTHVDVRPSTRLARWTGSRKEN